jgi:hypothetical protein
MYSHISQASKTDLLAHEEMKHSQPASVPHVVVEIQESKEEAPIQEEKTLLPAIYLSPSQPTNYRIYHFTLHI